MNNLSEASGFKLVIKPTFRNIDNLKLALFEADVEPNFANVTTVLSAVQVAFEQQLEYEQSYLIACLLEDGRLKADMKELA